MSLPARQQHALDEIELTLQNADPQLRSMFATFTRLTSLEAMPATEAIRARLPRVTVLISLIVAAVVGAVALGMLTPANACPRIPAGRVAVGPAAARVALCHSDPAAEASQAR
jgi:hypothetical protein